MGTVLCGEVNIGNRCIVGAGETVRQNVEDNMILYFGTKKRLGEGKLIILYRRV